MDKTKKIIISLSVSLIVLLIMNYVIISHINSDYIEVSVFKTAMLKGKQVEPDDITTIQIKKNRENEALMKNVYSASIVGKILNVDVFQGELALETKVIPKEQLLEENTNYSYISIPINNLTYPTCMNLKRGDKVAIYYTAKTKDVSNAIKDKQRLYSNTVSEGMVTCLLFEEIEVISVHDSTGKETKETVVTDVLVRLNREDAILVANLKSQGTFDIVLN